MNRNFDRFEVGHWYVYTGTDKHSCFVRGQEFVLDHKANKCIKASNVYRADFDRGHSDTSLPFTWEGLGKNNCFDNWIEVEDPTTAHDITSGEYFYVYRNNKIIISAASTCSIESNSTIYYKLVRPPYGESKMENKKEEFTPKKVKLSDNDDIWIECARYEELPCECYVAYYDNKLNIFAQRQNLIKVANINYGLPREYDGYLYAIPKARADEALKFVSNVKLSDLKPGVKVKIKEDAEWMEKYNPTSFKKGGIYTVESTDNKDWGMWSDTIKGAVTLKESEDYRFPIHWIEKIVEDGELNQFGINIHRSSPKIKITELKNKTDYAVYVKNNEERIKLMTAVGKKWDNGDSFEVNKCTYPTHMVMRPYRRGMLWGLSTLEPDPVIYDMSDIDFEEDKVYIKGTDFYIGEKVRVKKLEDIKENKLWPPEMRAFCGKDVSIRSASICGITLAEDGGEHGWHIDWFEHISEKEKRIRGMTASFTTMHETSCIDKYATIMIIDSDGNKATANVSVLGRSSFQNILKGDYRLTTFTPPNRRDKYIKLNKNPIKKIKEYKVHKKEYIPLNK